MILPRLHKLIDRDILLAMSVSLLVTLLVSFTSYFGGQGLDVHWKIKGNGSGLENVLITIKDSTNTKVIDTLRTNARGNAHYTLPFNGVYNVYFEASEYKTIFARFETAIPEKQKYSLQYYPSTVELLPKDAADINKKVIATRPFIVVSYNPAFNNFEGELQSISNFIAELDKPLIGSLYLRTYIPDTLMPQGADAMVFVYKQNGNRVDSSIVNQNDSAKFTLPLQEKYKIALESKDHLNTFASLNAHVPAEDQEDDYALTMALKPVLKNDTLKVPAIALASPAQEAAYDTTKSDFEEDQEVYQQFLQRMQGKGLPEFILAKGEHLHYRTKAPEEALLVLKEGDRVIDSVKVAKDGTYEVPLPYDAVLSLWTVDTSLHKAFVSFNTNIPLAERKKGMFTVKNIDAYPKSEDSLNESAFEIPTSKMMYNDTAGAFVEDAELRDQFATLLSDKPVIVKTDTLPETSGQMIISGVIRNIDRDKLANAEVDILINGKVSSVAHANDRGKYEITAPLNEYFTLVFKAEGHHDMKALFDSRVPDNEEAKSEEYSVSLPVDMIPRALSVNKKVAAKPFAKCAYDEEYEKFEYDFGVQEYYAENILIIDKPAAVDTAKVAVEEPTLFTQAIIKGQMVDEQNKPIPNSTVQLKDASGKVLKESTSDENGNYTFEALDLSSIASLSTQMQNGYVASTTINAPNAVEAEEITLPTTTGYSKDNPALNPAAFETPIDEFSISKSGQATFSNEKRSAFAKKLASPRTDTRLVLLGQVEDLEQNGVSQADVNVIIKKNDSIISQTSTDGKGGYRIALPYGEEYTVTIKKEGFHDVSYEVDTKLPEGSYRTNRSMKPTAIKMSSTEDEDIDEQGVKRTFNRIAFNQSDDNFSNSRAVHSSYMAALYKDEEPKPTQASIAQTTVDTTSKPPLTEKVYDYVVEQVKVKPYEKIENDGMAILNKREEKLKTEIRENRAVKQNLLGSIRNVVYQNDTLAIPNDKDVAYNTQAISSLTEIIVPNAQRDINNHVEEKVESMNRLNNVVAMALLALRRGNMTDTISWDSVFNVNVPIRIYESSMVNGVYSFAQTKVTKESSVDLYSRQTSWFVFDTYYKNGVEIDEDEYESEVSHFRKQAEVIIDV